MVKDKFLYLLITALFVLNLCTLGYIVFERNNIPHGMNEREHEEPLDIDPGKQEKNRPGRPDKLIIEKLKLNEEQIKQFEVMKKEHRIHINMLQDSSRVYHDEYFGLLKNSKTDTIKANTLLAKIAQNQIEIDKITYSHFEEIKAICDPTQKELFSSFIDGIARSFKPPLPKR